jgi:hypothetical protein
MNFHDERGVLLEQISMSTGIRWELAEGPDKDAK